MRGRYANRAVLAILLIWQIHVCLATETPDPNQSSKYLEAVRAFADNVLKYGRDTYGPKHTPLFVDGLNIHTHEPVKWIEPNGTKWILSNLASQQTLMRTLDGLSSITGDAKYREAAIQAIKYAFEYLRSPHGLLYWGHLAAYDASADKVWGDSHVFKLHYPYYELMWKVDPKETKRFIEAYWSAHVNDWSNLDFNRIALFDQRFEEPWNHEYDEDSPTFFRSKHGGGGFLLTGASLVHAGTMLHRLTGEEPPLIWSERLIRRFVDTRHPMTGIGSLLYNNRDSRRWLQLGEDMKEHYADPRTTIFPFNPFEVRYLQYPRDTGAVLEAFPWMSIFLVGKMLGEEGKDFTQWSLEEFTAWGKVSYRKKDNSFVPILTDGTNLEGYVWQKRPSGLNVAKPYPADPSFFWVYSVAYRTTGDEFMWEMVRDIALGNDFGDIGETPAHNPELRANTGCCDVYSLLGFLELYAKTKNPACLKMARRIGDNILSRQFHNGFFVSSKRHIYTRFDCFEPLALLHLEAAMKSKIGSVPRVWPSVPLFVHPYRHREQGVDLRVIYALTESPEPPMSLQEAAAVGDVDLVRTLVEEGADVDGVDSSLIKTALERAAMNGHKEVVALLIAKGAKIDAWRGWPGGTALDYAAEKGHREIVEMLIARGADVNAKRKGYPSGDTPLHSAARAGQKDIVELLIANGADVNAKNNEGQTPVDIAVGRRRNEVVRLLIARGADVSLDVAARFGALAKKVEDLMQEGVDINAKDESGHTALHYAVQGDHKELTEFLVAKGADVNAKTEGGYTPLTWAIWRENKDIIRVLVTKGADVNFTPKDDYPPLHYAVWYEDVDMVKLLVAQGAKFDVKDQDGWTAFRYAATQGNRDIVEFFIAKGADVSSFHMAACMGDLTRLKYFVEQGADVDTKDELGWTPLYWAASTGQENVAEFLIANGADVNAKTNYNSTPLYQAAATGGLNFVQLLISKGADVNAKDKHGNTPLHSAASAGHREVVELFISKGATVDAKGRNDWTPLHRAARSGHGDIVEFLVEKGADIDAKASSDHTALHSAAVRGRTDMAALLIVQGADLNSQNVNGQTPLHLSARQGQRDMVELLINKGADVNARNKWGRTPLDIAVGRGHTEIVELLRRQSVNDLVKSGSVNVKDKDGRTPLHHAAEAGLDGLVKELIVNNADVDATDIYGQTPLHCAAYKGHKNVAECLLAKGTHINARDNAGRAPLHYAVGAGKNRTLEAGHTDVVELLLAKGANVNAKDSWSWTPLHYAVRMANKAMVELLVNRGADLSIADKRGHTALSLAQRCLSLVRYILDSKISDVYRERIADLPNRYSEIVDTLRKGRHVYYVATDGNDSNSGTLKRPFKTLNAAIDLAEPGDTIFVRGGVYACSKTTHLDKSGEPGKPIILRAYPGETPVFDFSVAKAHGFIIKRAYWHIKGLTVTGAELTGIRLETKESHHNILEHIKAYANGLKGIDLQSGTSHNLVLNCDSYQNFDPETDGENADGFAAVCGLGKGNVLIGCRAWNNSDDGFDFWEAGTTVRAEKCYAWCNGENLWDHPCFTGNANGFKLGRGKGRHVLISCLAWEHNLTGFNLNNNTDGVILRNCTAWNNDLNYAFNWSGFSEEAREDCVFINNISYNGNSRDGIYPRADSQCNSWDAGLVLTGDDFLSLDDNKMSAPRNPDGSIPQNKFLKLAPTSDVIDKGVDIGMPFVGEKPDLGSFEYDPNEDIRNYVKMLHQYIRDHDMEKINETLSTGIDVNEKDWLGYAPLHWACYFGYADLVTPLIDKGADPNLISSTGRTSLEIATEMDYGELAELLKKHGAKE